MTAPPTPTRPASQPEIRKEQVMTDDMSEVIRAAKEIAPATETLYEVTEDLAAVLGKDQPVLHMLSATVALESLHPALAGIGRLIRAPYIQQACPAAALPHLTEAADLIRRADIALRKAERATVTAADQAGPATVTSHSPDHGATSGPGRRRPGRAGRRRAAPPPGGTS